MSLLTDLLQEIHFDNFVVLDLETTGLDPTTDRIIEIAAIRFREGKESDIFESLVNPGIPIPDFITKLTGINDEQVQNAPALESIFEQCLQFIGDSPLIGHQINFDAAFIEYVIRRQKNDFAEWDNEAQRFKYLSNLRMDTLFLARIFLPFLERFRLSTVAAHFDIDLDKAHRALDDARASGRIFIELIERTLACDEQILRMIIRLLYRNSSRVKYYFQPILDFKIKHRIKGTSAGITEDLAYFQINYNIIGESEYHHEEAEYEIDTEPIDAEKIGTYFGNKGALQHVLPNFESREQQQEMGRLIARSFNQSEFLIAEAGTGTGKSMAYLLPAVEWAVKNRESKARVIISTNTKNLQEQLFYKDIPTVYRVADQKFKAVLLKGKSNYLCLDKWKATLVDMDRRLSSQERTRILPLIVWAEQTQTGDIAENSGFQLNQNWGLWGKLIAENNYCPGRACKFYNECFLMHARNNARRADLVVVNHSLLFSDLVTDNSILGDYRNLVIDEAHNMEKTAGEYLGVRFNWWTFRNVYHKLYEEEPRKGGSLVQLEYRLAQARLSESISGRLRKQIDRLKNDCVVLKRTSNEFFTQLNSRLRSKFKQQNGNGFEETKIRYHKNFRYFTELFDQINELKNSLRHCKNTLTATIDSLGELRAESFQFQDQIHRELISAEVDLENLLAALEFCLMGDEDKYVYWLELPQRLSSNDVSFNAVPLNIAELLKRTLYDRLDSAVFTSATLAVDNSFDYFKHRVGLDLIEAKVASSILGSPFNYNKQLLLTVPDFLDDPRNERFNEQLGELIKDTHRQHPTGMLVLFTNYLTLNRLYNDLQVHFEAERILLLAQGKSGSRTSIINQFREYRESILFGTDSFWEGIDVPGDALELLLIAKLPFDVPSEPLVAAKLEEIKKNGGNPFLEYSVPEAIIKFRQGFGRLIRHKEDFGAVIVCDNRLNRMQYGKQFLNALPVEAKIYGNKDDLFRELKVWFADRMSPSEKVKGHHAKE